MDQPVVLTDEQLLDMALFTDAPPPGYVRREGMIFKIGSYPTHKFSLSEEEADAAIAAFRPVPGDLEHKPTVLSGKLGVLRKVWRNGQEIMGQADVPAWLDTELKGSASSISCAWDRATKRLKGWGWVLDPAVSGAALMGAYAAFNAQQTGVPVNTPATQPVAAPTQPVQFTQRQIKERRFMPLIDSIKKGLATFSNTTPPATPPPATPTTGVPGVTTPPAVPPAAPPTTVPVTTPMPTPVAPPDPHTPSPTPSAPVPQPTSLGVNFNAPGVVVEPISEAEADFKAKQIISRAEAMADSMITAGHLHSFGRNAAIARFTADGVDNERMGASEVTFTRADGTVLEDRVELTAEMLRATPKHSLFSSQLPVTVINGNKDASENVPAVEAGKKQAAEFNKQFEQTVPGLAQPAANSQNGH